MTSIVFKSLAAAALLTLGACTHDAEIVERMDPLNVRHPVVVEPQIRETRLLPDPRGLSDDDRTQLRTLAGEFMAGGHGRISIASPDGLPNTRTSIKTLSDAVAVMENAGVPRNKIDIASYPGTRSSDGAVVIAYMLYTAKGPDCGDFSENVGTSPENMTTRNFGCATQNNFAAMVEDPRDLVAPRGDEPASAARRSTMLKAYREGQATATARTEQDSGAVSSVGR